MIRNFNFQKNQRLDIPHMKMIESSVTHDLQVLASDIISGGKSIIIKGFTIPVTNVIGNPATSLQMITAGSVIIHPLGSEEGSLFTVSSTQAPERLNVNNFRVIGSFTSNAVNYIGIDLIRTVDTSTSDTVSILSDTTNEEFTQTVSLSKILDYRIYIQTVNFDSTPNVCPVAVVVVDALGGVSSVTDARPLAFRLGVGGTSPSATTPYYSLPDRVENPITFEGIRSSPFTGGDKSLSSFRNWMAVVETRIWEGNGGAHWYSPSNVNDVRPAYDNTVLFYRTSENWYLNGVDLLWQGIRFIFSNGTNNSYYCTVADQTTALVGLTDLNNGECLYIDIDRTRNATDLPVTKANFAAMPQPTIPGSRLIIAWKNFGSVYVYGQSAPVNSISLRPATTTTFGAVKINAFPSDRTEPVCPVVDASGNVIGNGLHNPGPFSHSLEIGTGTYDNSVHFGSASVYTTVSGILQAPNVLGSTEDEGTLSLWSTTSPFKGKIYLGGSGLAYYDENTETLQVPAITGSTLDWGALLLKASSLDRKGSYIYLGVSGTTFVNEFDQTLVVPTIRGSTSAAGNLYISSNVESHDPKVYLGSDNICFFSRSSPLWNDEYTHSLNVPVLRGSSAPGGNLTLVSTSNATKGLIYLGSGTVYDEVNDRLGVGMSSPSQKLDAAGMAWVEGNVRVGGNIETSGTFSIPDIILPTNWQTKRIKLDGNGYVRIMAQSKTGTLGSNIDIGVDESKIINTYLSSSFTEGDGNSLWYITAQITVRCISSPHLNLDIIIEDDHDELYTENQWDTSQNSGATSCTSTFNFSYLMHYYPYHGDIDIRISNEGSATISVLAFETNFTLVQIQ
jgi:hypothetical protein